MAMIPAVRSVTASVIRSLSSRRGAATWRHEELTSRGVISAKGRDCKELLQGLTTNDLSCLKRATPVIYSLLLNIKGRVLYDVLIYLKPDQEMESGYFIECDRAVIPDLLKHLKMYKLRKKAQLDDASSSVKVWGVLPNPDCPCPDDGCRPEVVPDSTSRVLSLTADPRVPKWSARLLLPADTAVTSVIQDTETASCGSYAAARYQLGIGEGVADFPPGTSLPLECNGALLHGISFNKGCYLGQELTARSHHTGVIRKRLMPLQLLDSEANPPDPNSEVRDAASGSLVGRCRSFVSGRGLGLLRLSSLSSSFLKIRCSASGREIAAQTWVPAWWPEDVGLKLP